jgi:hypothetical protein
VRADREDVRRDCFAESVGTTTACAATVDAVATTTEKPERNNRIFCIAGVKIVRSRTLVHAREKNSSQACRLPNDYSKTHRFKPR